MAAIRSVALVATFLISNNATADELEVSRGIPARWELTNGQSVLTMEDKPVVLPGPNPIADARITVKELQRVTWSGPVIIREPATYRFHARVSGSVAIRTNESTVLEAESDGLLVTGPPVKLTAGETQLEVQWTPSHNSHSQDGMQLYWSSDRFPPEPLPEDIFFPDEEFIPPGNITGTFVDSAVLAEARYGQSVADAYRCGACHSNLKIAEPLLKTPNLRMLTSDGVPQESARQSIISRLTRSADDAAAANSHMPAYRLGRSEAAWIAAALLSLQPTSQTRTKRASDAPAKDVLEDPQRIAEGQRVLFESGCVACHSATDLTSSGTAELYGGPPLDTLGNGRSATWLDRWLTDPLLVNSHARMPKISLPRLQRHSLIAALIAEQSTPATEVTPEEELPEEEQIRRGQALMGKLRCASCHDLNSTNFPISPATPIPSKTSGTCQLTAASRDAEEPHTPTFLMGARESRAVAAFIKTLPENSDGLPKTRPLSGAAFGQLALHRRNCLSCHDRNTHQGLSAISAELTSFHPELRGESQALIPPALTAVGDRLTDSALALGIAGNLPRRLPWLRIQMPHFQHSETESAAMQALLKTTDRIPAGMNPERENPGAAELRKPTTARDLLEAEQLAGAGGLNCVACHTAGNWQPKNVALGTRGSDLMTMGTRLRPEYFLRWMHNPIRVVAGIEMPAIRKPIPGLSAATITEQIALLWRGMRDRRMKPPSVTSRFEQLLVVTPGTPPVVVRDTFRPEDGSASSAVARAFAAGFGNGHNILLDLDHFAFRGWSVGELARQRTEGKSWFWDFSGSALMQQPALTEAPVHLLIGDGSLLSPVTDEGRSAQLLSYSIQSDRVISRHRFHFADVGTAGSLRLNEPHGERTAWDANHGYAPVPVDLEIEWSPWRGDLNEGSGLQLKFTLLSAPSDSRLMINLPNGFERTQQRQLFTFTAALDASDDPAPTDSPELILSLQAEDRSSAVLQFITSLEPAVLAPARLPPLRTDAAEIDSVPGWSARRLPLPTNIMPTAMTTGPEQLPVFTSLRGFVYRTLDKDGNGIPDDIQAVESGLAAPFGILADGNDLLIAHKPEVLRLSDTDHDGLYDQRTVVADGWGFTDDYHDWTTGLLRQSNGNLVVALGSDYSQKKRPATHDRWRGTVLSLQSFSPGSQDHSNRLRPVPLGLSLRFPVGLAVDAEDRIFATDNQGVQNTFNEINYIRDGLKYGVPSRHSSDDWRDDEEPAVKLPHPWSRSVNAIAFVPNDFPATEFRGHAIGCEYDNRFLVRMSFQEVNGQLQGASYPFSRTGRIGSPTNFLGPISIHITSNGAIYIGNISDSGWQGGRNTGEISLLRPATHRPNGFGEVTAVPGGFRVAWIKSNLVPAGATDPANWSVVGYTRTWSGNYASPDSDRHPLNIGSITTTADGDCQLMTESFRAGYVYEIRFTPPEGSAPELWPTEAAYTMNSIPVE